MIDNAENRFKFSRMLDNIGILQPRWKVLTTLEVRCKQEIYKEVYHFKLCTKRFLITLFSEEHLKYMYFRQDSIAILGNISYKVIIVKIQQNFWY